MADAHSAAMTSDAGDMCRAIRQKMEDYIPAHGFMKINILLMGMLGHGKSSLINSCLCVTRDEEYYNEAGSGESAAAITLLTKQYRLKGFVYIIDNRGLNKLNTEEQIEIASQYSKLRHLGEVQWQRAIDEIFQMCIRSMNNLQKELFVPVFVYSVQCLLSDKMYREIEPFIRQAQEITGIFPIIVLTKTTSTDGKQTMEQVNTKFKRLGANYVIPIENYTTTDPRRNEVTDRAVMKLLNTCLEEAQRVISKRERVMEDNFMVAVRQLKKSVEREIQCHDEEIRRKDERIQSLEKQLQEKCNLM